MSCRICRRLERAEIAHEAALALAAPEPDMALLALARRYGLPIVAFSEHAMKWRESGGAPERCRPDPRSAISAAAARGAVEEQRDTKPSNAIDGVADVQERAPAPPPARSPSSAIVRATAAPAVRGPSSEPRFRVIALNPSPSPRCRCCNLARRAELHELAAGRAIARSSDELSWSPADIRMMARRFRVSASALERHLDMHVLATVAERPGLARAEERDGGADRAAG